MPKQLQRLHSRRSHFIDVIDVKSCWAQLYLNALVKTETVYMPGCLESLTMKAPSLPCNRSKGEKTHYRHNGKKEVGWGQSSACFSPVYAQSRGCAKHVGEKRAISQLTELGLFHAQLRWLPRDCRYTQLVSLGCYVFLVQFPEEMRLMCSYWVCVGVGTRACVCLSLQASPLEILNPLIAFNPIWRYWWYQFPTSSMKWAAVERQTILSPLHQESSYRTRVPFT